MNGATLTEGRQDVSSRNPYALAGGLALAQAVLYPVGIFLAVVAQIIGQEAFDYRGPVVGPGDFLLVLFTAFGVYTIWRFKSLLNERFGFHALDLLLQLMIAFNILSLILGLLIDGVAIVTGQDANSPLYVISSLVMLVVFAISGGILNILIGLRLMGAKDELGDLIKAYGVLVLIAGILMATVFLIPLAALMVPITCIVLAMIFFRDREAADFV